MTKKKKRDKKKNKSLLILLLLNMRCQTLLHKIESFKLTQLKNKVLLDGEDKEELLLMITAAHNYCIWKPMPALFHTNSFYRHTRYCDSGFKNLFLE